MRHWPETIEEPDSTFATRLLPTYDEEHENGFDEEHLIPVQLDNEMGGLRVALLSQRNSDGTVSLTKSPEVYIERHSSEWRILIVRISAGDEDLLVRVPDDGGPIVAKRMNAQVRWEDFWQKRY